MSVFEYVFSLYSLLLGLALAHLLSGLAKVVEARDNLPARLADSFASASNDAHLGDFLGDRLAGEECGPRQQCGALCVPDHLRAAVLRRSAHNPERCRRPQRSRRSRPANAHYRASAHLEHFHGGGLVWPAAFSELNHRNSNIGCMEYSAV